MPSYATSESPTAGRRQAGRAIRPHTSVSRDGPDDQGSFLEHLFDHLPWRDPADGADARFLLEAVRDGITYADCGA